jgi:hypothetical protein
VCRPPRRLLPLQRPHQGPTCVAQCAFHPVFMEKTNLSYYTVPAAWPLCVMPHFYAIGRYTAQRFRNPRLFCWVRGRGQCCRGRRLVAERLDRCISLQQSIVQCSLHRGVHLACPRSAILCRCGVCLFAVLMVMLTIIGPQSPFTSKPAMWLPGEDI